MLIFPDPAPTVTSNSKVTLSKTGRLTFSNVSTGGTTTALMAIPKGANIQQIRVWKKTAFSGGGVTAVTLSVGITGSSTKYVTAADIHSQAAGTTTVLLANNLITDLTADEVLLFLATATTGNPTAGEVYATVEYTL